MKQTLRSYSFVALTCLMLLFTGIQLSAFQLALSSASRMFGVNKTGMGLLVAAQYSSMIAAPILSGILADRYGKKPILLAASGSIILGCAVAGSAGSIYLYALGIFFVGAGSMICESICSAAISDLHPQQSARLLSLTQCCFSVGAIIGPIALQGAMDRLHAPWQSLYLVYGVAFIVLLLPLLRARLPKPDAVAKAAPFTNPMRFLRSPSYLLLFGGIIFYVGLENGIGCFAQSLFDLHLNAAHLGAYAISAFWAGMAVSRLVSGVKSLPAGKTVIIYYLFSALLLLGLALSNSAGFSLVLSGLVGFAYGPIWSSLVSLAAGEFPGHSAGAVGLMGSGCGIGGALYPVLMGALADAVEIRVAFFLLAGTAFVGLLFGLVYRRRTRHLADQTA